MLGLAPLRRKLGPKWERLSNLVHQLFETALAHRQGPSDHFISLDELSYVVTFHDLSPPEAALACTAVAKVVCEKLFGDQIDEVSVRSLVAEIAEPQAANAALNGRMIEELLEKLGAETLITQSRHSGSPEPVVTRPPSAPSIRIPWEQHIAKSHDTLAQAGLKIGFFPAWELRSTASSALCLVPFSGRADRMQARGFESLQSMDDKTILGFEIDLLNACAAYAMRINESGQVAAVGVGVSYNTLSQFHTRMRYIAALQKIPTCASAPILLKVEHVPAGAPIARIAELVALMRFPSIRVTIEFKDLSALPEMEIRMGAKGIGGAVPQTANQERALQIMKKLVRRAADQKSFAFLDRLDSPWLVNAAARSGVRFGTGTALGTRHFSGLEKIPQLPLAFQVVS